MPFDDQFNQDQLNQSIRVGGRARITHRDGKGGVKVTEGTLLDSDDDGYIVIKDDEGEMCYIPKGNVVDLYL